MLLREISPSDPVTTVVLRGLEFSAPILQDAQFYPADGNADSLKERRESAAKAKITRGLNEENTPAPPTPAYVTGTKKIISFTSTVDRILEQRNADIEAELFTETYNDSVQAGYRVQDLFFNGDVAADAENFDGLFNVVNSSYVYEGVDDGGVLVPVGGSDDTIADKEVAVERFLQSAERVKGGAQVCYMNNALKVRWLTVAKSLNYYRSSKDELGNTIDMINDVVIRGAGRTSTGSYLLPFTEDDGLGNSNTSSMFFVRWGEKTDVTVLTSIGVRGEYDGPVGQQYQNSVNGDAVIMLVDPTALVQVKGWRVTVS
jgi:hypothetical protein